MCMTSDARRQKPLGHTVHLKGFSSLCVLMWSCGRPVVRHGAARRRFAAHQHGTTPGRALVADGALKGLLARVHSPANALSLTDSDTHGCWRQISPVTPQVAALRERNSTAGNVALEGAFSGVYPL
jgi:hypothetical protein